MRARRLVPSLLALPLVALAGCGGGDDDERAAGLPPGCEAVEAASPNKVSLEKPGRGPVPSRQVTASVETSCGRFEIALDPDRSPKTVRSFVHLVREGVYDGTAIHRIVPDFVIQGGDPKGDGTGGPGYFVDEPPPPDTEYTRGTVAMAKSEVEPPGRSGSQFFVVVAADAGLPPDFALLGKVSAGMGVVERIEKLGDPASGQEGRPRAPVVIERIALRER